MIIEIDSQSGFCFGVNKAVSKVEQLLSENNNLVSLGEIVHNHEEVQRLSHLGLKTINFEEAARTFGQSVLIRTHGEPPSTYMKLQENNNEIIDATCPVVLKLQERIRKSFENQTKNGGQLIIVGKNGHPEVIGLLGQTDNKAIIIHSINDLDKIDFNLPVEIFAQTTMPLDTFDELCAEMQKRANNSFLVHDTICRQVSNRIPRMKEFSGKFDVVLFVSGKNSSNGKALFNICKKTNRNSFFISNAVEIQLEWFNNVKSIGICGATSTPQWLMNDVKTHVSTILNL